MSTCEKYSDKLRLHLAGSVLLIDRITNGGADVTLVEILACRGVMSERTKVIVAKNHSVTDHPSKQFY